MLRDKTNEQPQKDRRALLTEWRKQARSRSGTGSASTSITSASSGIENSHAQMNTPSAPVTSIKRSRLSLGVLPSAVAPSPASQRLRLTEPSPGLPPSYASSDQPMGATQRFRLAKEKQRQQQRGVMPDYENNNNNQPPRHPPITSPSLNETSYIHEPCFSQESSMSASFVDDIGETNVRNRHGKSGGSRRMSIAGGAKKMRRKSIAVSNSSFDRGLSQDSMGSSHQTPSFTDHRPKSAPRLDNDESSANVGLKSRLVEMQQRIERLEQEKIDLSMSKAPLESRLRQTEEAWLKDRTKLIQQIEDMKNSAKGAEERFLSIEMERDGLVEENSKLKLSALKASSSVHSNSLTNDRDLAELKDKYKHTKDEIHCLKIDKISLESDLKATNMELDSLFRAHEDLQAEFKEVATANSQTSDAVVQLEALTTEHIATSAQLNAVCADLAETKSNNQALIEEMGEKYKRETSELKFEISVLRARRGNLDEDGSGEADDVEDEAVLRARIEERDNRIRELEEHLFKSEQMRRIMHNRIQELRGNIRVFVRTRPFLPGDGKISDSPVTVSPDGEGLTLIRNENDKQKFVFDKVFAPSVGQDGVFTEISDFVQSALDGYNTCLFSYGQTGSGKTHTMQGSGNGAMRGIIPRAVEQILSQAGILRSQKWSFSMSASFLEIYNEELRDLLTTMEPKTTNNSKITKLAIKRDRKGKGYVDGLTKVKIETGDSVLGLEQLEKVISAAAKSRSVACTKMNSQSSRSHSVFMLHLQGVNEENGTVVQGSLNLCDLAGSERLDRSGAADNAKRLKETQAINKSLSCLGDVFNSLASGASHIPFRNSKLTYLLQDCLSGDGKALMFVNLSPTEASSHESLCSLRFAQRVNQVELGKAKKHVQYMK